MPGSKEGSILAPHPGAGVLSPRLPDTKRLRPGPVCPVVPSAGGRLRGSLCFDVLSPTPIDHQQHGFFFFFLFLFFFFWLSTAYGVLSPGIRSEPQLPPKLQLQQHGILNPGYWTRIEPVSQHSQNAADPTAPQQELRASPSLAQGDSTCLSLPGDVAGGPSPGCFINPLQGGPPALGRKRL